MKKFGITALMMVVLFVFTACEADYNDEYVNNDSGIEQETVTEDVVENVENEEEIIEIPEEEADDSISFDDLLRFFTPEYRTIEGFEALQAELSTDLRIIGGDSRPSGRGGDASSRLVSVYIGGSRRTITLSVFDSDGGALATLWETYEARGLVDADYEVENIGPDNYMMTGFFAGTYRLQSVFNNTTVGFTLPPESQHYIDDIIDFLRGL